MSNNFNCLSSLNNNSRTYSKINFMVKKSKKKVQMKKVRLKMLVRCITYCLDLTKVYTEAKLSEPNAIASIF